MAVRSILILLTAVSLVASVRAIAVGLGEIRLDSTLNQPLSAEIELLSTEGHEAGRLRAQLGSPEDFALAGIERPFFLTQLGFRPVLDQPDGPVLKVTSSRPVREPFLNFLVRLEWPGGQLLRAYTLLLDLPDHDFNAAAARTTSGPATFENSSVESQAATNNPGVRPLRRPEQTPIPAGSGSYTVRQGDTLWSVASRARPDGLTVQQTLMAIYRLNPDAFIDGDMNRLRRDHALRVPEAAAVAAIDLNEARATVWRESVDAPSLPLPLDATTPSAATTSASAVEGQLRLAAPQMDDDSAGGAAVGTADETPVSERVSEGVEGGSAATDGIALPDDVVDSKVLYLEEEMLLARRENQELQERISNLEEQLTTVSRLVELQSDTLAATRPAQDAPVETVAVAPSEPTGDQESSGMTRLLWLLLAAILVLVVVWILLRRRREAQLEELMQQFPPEASDIKQAKNVYASDSLGEADSFHEAASVHPVGAAEPSEESTQGLTQEAGSLPSGEETIAETTAPVDGLRNVPMADFGLLDNADEGDGSNAPIGAYDSDENNTVIGNETVILGTELQSTAAESDQGGELSLEEWFAELEEGQPDTQEAEHSVPPATVSITTSEGFRADTQSEHDDQFDLTFDLDFANLAVADDDLAPHDPLQTRLELARVYLDMQDAESARDILEEMIDIGDSAQQSEARELLDSIS